MNSKIKIRNKRQLILRKKAFIEITDQLKKSKIPFFLYGGVLLGFIREKNFIKWDWDAEFTILTDEVFDKKKELNDLFLKSGFKIVGFSYDYENFKWELEKYNFCYELIGMYRQGEWLYRKGKGTKVPAIFFDKPSDLFFLGNLYKTVSEPKKYLKFCYGDWQTPKRTLIKKDYLTTEYQPRFKMHRIFFQKLINAYIKFKKIFK